MAALLSQLLLSGFALAVLATVGLFVGRPRTPRLGLLGRSLVGAGVAGVLALGMGAALRADGLRSGAVAAVLAAAVLLTARVGSAWNLRGVWCWSLSVTTGLAFLLYVAHWTLTASIGPGSRVAAAALLVLEVFVFALSLGYLWELVDVLGRWDWRRRIEVRHEVAGTHRAAERPFVSVHVPTHNEPPDMVIDTLRALQALEYDAFEVMVLDNNTDDPALWTPVKEYCGSDDRLRFVHLADWPGYKSGALNYGLAHVDPRTDLVAIVDADYQVEPDFLATCAPLFQEPELAFVQTPQDYRDWRTDPYFRRLYFSYRYFFDVSQRSRNERDGAIFGGTMGLIRRAALVEVGGWDEWCITEDAELSLRLLKAGWTGVHVEQSFGHGIMPLTFEALKRQRFRWCFGGVQILRMHARSLLPGRASEANHLSTGQRWAYLSGGLQWFGDAAGLLFTLFLLVGALNLTLGVGPVVRGLTSPVLACMLGLVVLGAVRSLALVHRTSGARWREAVGAFLLWLSLGWVVALGSVRGLLAREGVFLRTPKVRGDLGWRDALSGNRVEVVLALVCSLGFAATVSDGAAGRSPGAAAVLGILLAVQAFGYAMAPYNSIAAMRADLSTELLRRRRERAFTWTRVRPVVRRAGLVPALVVAGGLVVVVALAAPVGGPGLNHLPHVATPPLPSATPSPHRGPHRSRSSTSSPGTGTAPSPTVVPAASTSPTTAKPSPSTGRSTSTRPTQAATPTARPTAQATPTARATGRPTASPSPSRKPTSRPSPSRRP